MKRNVVTGGAGFIGSHIVDALLARGEKVLVVDDFSSGSEKNLEQARGAASDRLLVHKLDICSPEIEKVFADYKPEVVFHHAAQMNVRKSVSDPAFDADKNVVGTVNILESARKAGCREVYFSSTGGAIYGEQDNFPADETHACKPECPYGVSKHSAELYLEYYARYYKMRCVALRYANVYGPRQNPKGEAGVVAIFCERLFGNQPFRVNGDGKQTRDFVYVADVVDANLAASGVDSSGYYIYNVGQGIEISVLDIVEELKSLWPECKPKGAADLIYDHGPAMPGEQQRSVISAKKLSTEFDWQAKTDFKKGLKRTLLSYIA